ncbi:superoxide dismutase family protein [Rhodococcus maanshanensis]|jgi:superoxide dismutase, Cu-Zn family|uniref:superoxide dismutase family protein n=1 Tax=Rhodococcus maanshanensis TaxID=183556 RepID=UPI0022B51708|nr:superoxide dismutase family protein [Rhodococcus maanshanensis]MCZ4554139.1 superoxide dismutase family protein [Rhodococcus maanshanensis]
MYTRCATLIAGASVTVLVVAGCGNDDESTDDSATVETPPTSLETATTSLLTPRGGFTLPVEGGTDNAFTYDEAAVPVGSSVNVDSEEQDGRTTVTFSATGLAPNRDFGVHVHTRACGREPSDSGPHYQNDVDPMATPESPSSDPAYANPQNEIWLDVTTDGNGNAQSSTAVNWEFRDDEANSVVLHAQRTKTGPGVAGMAGDRLACIDEDL